MPVKIEELVLLNDYAGMIFKHYENGCWFGRPNDNDGFYIECECEE